MYSTLQLRLGGEKMNIKTKNNDRATAIERKWKRIARRSNLLVVFAAAVSAAFAQTSQELKLIVGKSVVIDYPADIGRISTSNPEVVDYVAVSTREILLHAKGNGSATLIVWSKSGQREFYSVNVEGYVS
jgi:Flp pilus assembly secretin CpaC